MTTQELAYTEVERLVTNFKSLPAPQRKGMNEMNTQLGKIAQVHAEIDQRVYALYGLTEEEIKFMYFDERNPSHFHARYNEDRAVVSINDLKVLEGRLPKRALSLVLEWANEHRDELMNNWNSLRTTGEFSKIAPLE